MKKENKATKLGESLDTVSELTTNRLSVYLRCLNALDAAGVRTVSSQTLAEQFHLNAAQIRKDLAYFGEFGVRGVGYYVRELRSHLRQILGLDQRVPVGIMGAGNLGLALADCPGFQIEGFEIAALFDTVRERSGSARAEVSPFSTSQISGGSSAKKRSKLRSSPCRQPQPPASFRPWSMRASKRS
jgi:NADH/NAD ratio-sensing transcriptional regulator Rex